ncbi:type II secretion system minor pseudopilin GspJ [Parvularcula sp. LCG005]|uniref:type II secretion system minor pseudopilin GspJ n=1 Tax=Parvularcula sp. LCG005 TaxID=3078805 RepID=UPI002943C0BC|nr:type II secretion system minor pseudopilin GspJ [Parvularcula sp. LCG005]WOI54373.1 type II secretion system minor pseudopilin GspJ [Parvularcula sp. LCG005]
MRGPGAQKGMSLVELLVALTVFAFVSAAAVSVLNIGASGRQQVEDVTDDLGALERARSVIRTDLMQVVDRPYREANGGELIVPMLGGVDADGTIPAGDSEKVLAAFVRNGWTNPNGAYPRSSLQHVTYILRGSDLIRRTRPFLDAAERTPRTDQILFSNVQEVGIAFELGVDWQGDWSPQQGKRIPDALRLTMVHPVYGRLQQDFLVGGME